MLKIKRVYEPPSPDDGKRILIDRLWPRGLKREKAHVDEWLRNPAPNSELRKWFGYDPTKWTEFKKKYRKELGETSDLVEKTKAEAKKETVRLVFSTKDAEHNNAAFLKELLSREQ